MRLIKYDSLSHPSSYWLQRISLLWLFQTNFYQPIRIHETTSVSALVLVPCPSFAAYVFVIQTCTNRQGHTYNICENTFWSTKYVLGPFCIHSASKTIFNIKHRNMCDNTVNICRHIPFDNVIKQLYRNIIFEIINKRLHSWNFSRIYSETAYWPVKIKPSPSIIEPRLQ